jgi:hypothetical protein
MRSSVAAQAKHQPVISVDTKKKELVGNFKNGGTDYRPKGNPQRVNVHDFEDKKLGKVVPYGVYDVTANTGFVTEYGRRSSGSRRLSSSMARRQDRGVDVLRTLYRIQLGHSLGLPALTH